MADLVAWVVTLLDGEHQDVVYERSEGRARVRGARIHGLEPKRLPATREPRLDAHAPGPVPVAALLALGWWWECSWCNHRVDQEGCWRCVEDIQEETGEDAEMAPPVACGTEVWCSEACRATEVWWRRERKRIADAARVEALQVLPGSRVEEVAPGSDTATVCLRVPGCQGRVTFRWPEGSVWAWHQDHPVVRDALRSPPLECWESEGGAVHG